MPENSWENVVRNSKIPTVNGLEVSAGTNFIDAVRQEALRLNYNSPRVSLNGVEISIAEAPDLLLFGDVVKVTPYDKAG